MSWAGVEKKLREGVKTGVYSGAGAGILVKGKTPKLYAEGLTRQDKEGRKVTVDTLFDLASLTKVLATTTIIARLCDRGVVDLSTRLADQFPEFQWSLPWREIQVEEILRHRAGFPAWCDLSKECSVSADEDSATIRNTIYRWLTSMPPGYSPGSKTVYSDLGFILLSEWIARVTGKSFEDVMDEEVRTPLGISSLVFSPIKRGISRDSIAATEESQRRGGLIHGEVHDDNAYLLGGVVGHAGLFGTGEDCLKVGLAWLEALKGNGTYLSRAVAARFATPSSTKDGEIRAVGWDLPTPKVSSAGKLASEGSLGHLGYAGTSIWIDRARQAVVVLLTNRVHLSSECEKIRAFRPEFHDQAWKAIDK